MREQDLKDKKQAVDAYIETLAIPQSAQERIKTNVVSIAQIMQEAAVRAGMLSRSSWEAAASITGDENVGVELREELKMLAFEAAHYSFEIAENRN